MLLKLVRILALIAILFPLISSPAPVAAGCTSPITPGDWYTKPGEPVTYQLEIDMPISKDLPVGNFVGQMLITGEMKLKVKCDGTLTGSVENLKIDFNYTVLGQKGGCQGSGKYEITAGKVIAGEGGEPRFMFDSTTYIPNGPMVCNPGEGGAMDSGTQSFEFQASSHQGNTVSGNANSGEKDPFYRYVWLLAQSNSTVDWVSGSDLTVNWTLYNDAELPVVTNAEPQYEIYFLTGIPVANDLTATVDWKKGTPDFVTFKAKGSEVNVKTSDTQAKWTYPMGDLEAGLNPVSLTATDTDGLTSAEYLYNFHGVAVPNWAVPAKFQAEPKGENILYSGNLKFPKEPFSKMVELPAIIPVVGGKWGITPIQFNAETRANSSGAPTTGPVTGTGGLALGQDTLELKTKGQVQTQLTEDTLLFDSPDSYADLEFDPPPYNKQVSIFSLVPGASSLFSIPVIGPLLQSIANIAGVTFTVDPKLSGKGYIDIDPKDDLLGFTKGQVTSQLILKALANIDLKLVSAYAGGGGEGSLTIDVAAPPSVAACYLKLFVTAGAKVAAIFGGGELGPLEKDWTVAQCAESAWLGAKTLARPGQRPAPQPLPLVSRPAGWQAEESVLHSQTSGAFTETVLAENASAEAGPSLAVGRSGQLALAWMTEDPAKPRQQALEVVVRQFDGQNWSEVIPLTANSALETAPSAGFDQDGQLVVVWMANKTPALESNAVFDEALARNFDLAYAVLDSNGRVISSGKLTDDEIFDFNPRIAVGSDGSLWVSWSASPGTLLAGTAAAPNQLLAAHWDGKAWGQPEIVSEKLVGALNWTGAVNQGNEFSLAADLDTDGDLSTTADREIFLFTREKSGWNEKQVTQNNLVDTAPVLTYAAGKLALGWASGEKIVGLVGNQTTPVTWLDETTRVGAALNGGSLLSGPGGELALLWTATSATGADLYLSRQAQDGTWSQPAAQFQTSHQRRTLSAGLTPQGDLLLGLARLELQTIPVTLADGAKFSFTQPKEQGDLLVARQAGFMPAAASQTSLKSYPIFIALLCLALLIGGGSVAFGLGYFFLRKKPATRS